MEKKKPNICLLGASFNTNNLGVNVLAVGTLKTFFHKFPEGDLFLLDYGKEGATHAFQIDSRTIPVQLINIRFSKKFYLKNNIAFLILLAIISRLIPFRSIREKVISGNFCLSRMSTADIVSSMAGGDSFSDIYGLARFFYVSLPQILALSLGKKLILLPQTIGPFNSRISKIIARYIMNRASVIYSRDYIGLGETRKLLRLNETSVKIRFCYDVGFVLDPIRPGAMDLSGLPEKSNSLPVVGLNVSGLLYMGGYTRDNMFGLRIDYRGFIYELIDYLINLKRVNVLLVPHVFGTHEESDKIVCEKLYDELKGKYADSLFLAKGEYNQSEIKYIIGLCDFFVGSRMHACIAALSQHVPTVSIAYSKKFYGVMQSIGVESLVADPHKLDNNEIIKIIEEAYEQRALLHEQLRKTIPHVKETVLNLFADIMRPS